MKRHTKGFAEPLFGITTLDNTTPLAVVGAPSREVALTRAEMIRHVVPLPRTELLRARFVRSGPVKSPFFAAQYFAWLEALLEDARRQDEGICPLCGAPAKER